MNYLGKMLKIQKDFQKETHYDPRIPELASAIMVEAGETWSKAGGKWWKNYLGDGYPHGKLNHVDANSYIKAVQNKSKEEIKEEIIDQFHFLLCELIEMGMSDEETYTLYCKKMGVNLDRQKNKY